MATDSLFEIARAAGRLKRLPRTGWVTSGVRDPESVAEHSFRLAVLALAVAGKVGADPLEAAAIALVHDLAESVVGDHHIPESLPDAEARRRTKAAAEAEVFAGIVRGFDDANDWLRRLREYQEASTPEGQLVRELDKLEMAMSALDYETEGGNPPLDEFWASAAAGIKNPLVAELLERARAARP